MTDIIPPVPKMEKVKHAYKGYTYTITPYKKPRVKSIERMESSYYKRALADRETALLIIGFTLAGHVALIFGAVLFPDFVIGLGMLLVIVDVGIYQAIDSRLRSLKTATERMIEFEYDRERVDAYEDFMASNSQELHAPWLQRDTDSL